MDLKLSSWFRSFIPVAGTDPDHPRRFELVREEDASGVSGTGIVAVGVEWPDGAVSMMWNNRNHPDLDTNSNGMSFKPAPDGIRVTKMIHGHEGRTRIRWIDEERESSND